LNNGVLPIRAYPQYDRVVKLFGVYPYVAARALHNSRAIPWLLSRDFGKETRGTDFIDETARRIGYGRMAGLSAVAAHQYYLFRADLPAYVLNYLGDRVEMANSIEGRVPLLDHKLVEFAFALPVSLKLRNGVGKYILRQAILNRLPAAAHVKKRPFVAPSADTLGLTRRSEGPAHFLERDAIRNAGLFDPLAIRAVHRLLRFLPAGSRALALAESMLTGVVSIHALHEMFCQDFAGSMERFSNPAIKTLLHEGAVPNPAHAGGASIG
jgi:asparagine synthase (glutamine-hydrolysing)